MGSTQTAEEPHLLFVLVEVGDGRPGNNPSHAVSDQVDDDVFLLVLLQVIRYILLNLITQIFAHFLDIPISIFFIASGDEIVSVRQLQLYPSFDEVHIVAGSLIPVAEDDEHVLLGILIFAGLGKDLLILL